MSDRAWRLIACTGVVLALAAGVTLRLVWPADMEFKSDEAYTFQRTQRVGVSEPWPTTGMSNSANVPHPGMSVWAFVALARLYGADSPLELNSACMAVNASALVLLAIFVARVVPKAEREIWWWATALVAVNPMAVLFHRKIWPPSILPAISVVMLTCWWYRDRKAWAFAWGLIAALAAQIHPGAFFFATGMAAWALVFDCRGVRWPCAAAGGLVGSLTAWPWLYHLCFVAERSASANAQWWRIAELKFWTYWLTEPFGLGLSYSLGSDFTDFLAHPLIAGRPTYLVGILHGVLLAALVVVIGAWLRNHWKGIPEVDVTRTGFTIAAVAGGYGLLLSLTGLPVYRHYLIIAFPVTFVALARAAFAGFAPGTARRILAGLCAAQCAVTVLFLGYVHGRDSLIRGDYGLPYRAQLVQRQVADGGHR